MGDREDQITDLTARLRECIPEPGDYEVSASLEDLRNAYFEHVCNPVSLLFRELEATSAKKAGFFQQTIATKTQEIRDEIALGESTITALLKTMEREEIKTSELLTGFRAMLEQKLKESEPRKEDLSGLTVVEETYKKITMTIDEGQAKARELKGKLKISNVYSCGKGKIAVTIHNRKFYKLSSVHLRVTETEDPRKVYDEPLQTLGASSAEETFFTIPQATLGKHYSVEAVIEGKVVSNEEVIRMN